MILTLDVGNSQIHGGVFEAHPPHDRLLLQFRKSSKHGTTSDELGLFLRSAIRENGHDPANVHQVALCSVVPDLLHSLGSACIKYFGVRPFVLQAGVKTGLKIRYRNPLEVGSDRIANAIGASTLFPGKNLIVIDLGTATTFCAISADKDYLGGLILPGLRISMEALETKTARLPVVEIVAARELVGRSTIENIQAGLYFGHLAALTEITRKIKEEYFAGKETVVIGTGGFSRLFEKEKVFDEHMPELVLIGLNLALRMNA